MYQNPYLNSYNPQANLDRINNQIAELEKLKSQIPLSNQMVAPTQPAINQTFQLAPNNQSGIKFVEQFADVGKELVIGDTPFFSRDFSQMWLKNAKGEIRTFELKEIIAKDEKDLVIDDLRRQIEEMREVMESAKSNNANAYEPIKDEKPERISTSKPSKAK